MAVAEWVKHPDGTETRVTDTPDAVIVQARVWVPFYSEVTIDAMAASPQEVAEALRRAHVDVRTYVESSMKKLDMEPLK